MVGSVRVHYKPGSRQNWRSTEAGTVCGAVAVTTGKGVVLPSQCLWKIRLKVNWSKIQGYQRIDAERPNRYKSKTTFGNYDTFGDYATHFIQCRFLNNMHVNSPCETCVTLARIYGWSINEVLYLTRCHWWPTIVKCKVIRACENCSRRIFCNKCTMSYGGITFGNCTRFSPLFRRQYLDSEAPTRLTPLTKNVCWLSTVFANWCSYLNYW